MAVGDVLWPRNSAELWRGVRNPGARNVCRCRRLTETYLQEDNYSQQRFKAFAGEADADLLTETLKAGGLAE